jgi:putative membrane-bound dehydrogenase-like protein
MKSHFFTAAFSVLLGAGITLNHQFATATDLVGGEYPNLLPPEEAITKFRLHPDYQINLYASEVEFPLHSPAAMTFDAQGRLWVGNIPTQPHAKPGVPIKDSVIILEDTDRDGKADKHTVFYEGLYLPLGLAVTDGGRTAYVTDEPNLVRLHDKDGDGVADEKEIVLSGFGTEDNHHFISAFQWGPDGRLYFGQGLFLHSQVETPYGPVRAHEAALFRFDHRDQRLEVFASYGWSNVWGVVFNNWGDAFLADASPALNYYVSQAASNFTYPKPDKYVKYPQIAGSVSFTPEGRRPSCGNELLLSEHFPEEVRGWYVTNQMKGWHGLRWYKLEESGSGVSSSQPYGEDNELLTTSDIMFRPVAQQIGPDGALYVLDYYNPIVGHTTYSFRDPRHIKTHGRVWRITHKNRPLVWQPKILGEPVETLLGHLGNPNFRTGYFARRELQERSPSDVLPAVKKWLAEKSASTEAGYDKEVEALWMHQSFNQPDLDLLKKLLASPEHHVRTAALRVLRYWQTEMKPEESLALLKTGVEDSNQRVRLEALVDLGYHVDPNGALPIASIVLDQEMDAGMINATRETLFYLVNQTGGIEKAPAAVDKFMLPFSKDAVLISRNITEAITEEILKRPTLARSEHQRAIDFLVEKSGDQGSSLAAVVGRLQKEETQLPSLETLLLTWAPEEIAKEPGLLKELLAPGKPSGIQTAAQAALFRAKVPEETIPALTSPTLLAMAATRAGRGNVPEKYFPLFAKNLQMEKPSLGAMQPFLTGIASFPAKDAEALKLLADTSIRFESSDLGISFAALDAMKRIPANLWPAEYANKTLNKVTITATPDLKFSPTEFSVKAGSAVELLFSNPDSMYHNLVIVNDGALEEVGMKADLMAARPDGLDKNYVPDDPNVLHWTPQITLGIARSHVLKFYAPEKAGEYPYICTFPGHWRVMRGVMKVTE